MLAAALLLTAAAETPGPDEAALARAIGDRVAGKPTNCLSYSPADINSVEIVPGTAIIYRVGSRLYVNRPLSGAASLRRDDILVTPVFGGNLCRIDSVTLRDAYSSIPHGVIALGDFVPYERARPPR